MENGVISGGLGSAVLEYFADHGKSPRVVRLGLPDAFIEHGSIDDLNHLCGIDTEGIAESILKLLTDKTLL